MSDMADTLRQAADWFEQNEKFPYGPPVEQQVAQQCGDACVRLCGEDLDKARTLWKLVAADCDGYMPAAVARALVRAGNTVNLVPDVTAPEPQA